MKTGRTVARFAALLAALATGLVANAGTIRDCEGPNHYILSKCEDELRLEWVAVPDALLAHGWGHAATLLADGRVLVVGGGQWSYDAAVGDYGPKRIGAETYDPVSRRWRLTAPMHVARLSGVHAVRLLDGRVLVLGGESLATDPPGSPEIFDPAGETWTRTANLVTERIAFTATLLAHGDVLVAGGMDREGKSIAFAEIYNPASATWRTVAGPHEERLAHVATTLADGRVLVAGGVSDTYDSWFEVPSRYAEAFDPTSETWVRAGFLAQGAMHTATPLGDGRVLVAGGVDTVNSTRLYDLQTNAWADTGSLLWSRYGHLAVAIPGRGVLLVGGVVAIAPAPNYRIAPVERLEFFDLATRSWRAVAAINELQASASDYYSATPLADGSVLLIGDAEGRHAAQLRY
jgi:hypothetical protein